MGWIIWVAFACLVGVYWKGRGLSYWQGFIYSIILSPILAGVIDAIRKPNAKKIEEGQLKSGYLKNVLCVQNL